MLGELFSVVKNDLPKMLYCVNEWDSLIVNKRKPFTYRAFKSIGDKRICLHRFDKCDENESFIHPHPWQGAFLIVKGAYIMKIGTAKDRFSIPEHFEEMHLTAGSAYSITSPLTFHSVTPLETCYTIMLNSVPFPDDVAHTKTRTTKGKDLQKMSETELTSHIWDFIQLLGVVIDKPKLPQPVEYVKGWDC
jgi:hypothetical protein